MFRFRSISLLLAAVVTLGFGLQQVQAGPINYNLQLAPNVVYNGLINQPVANYDNPVGAEYYSMFANAGDLVTVTVRRLVGGYDPAMWVLSGLFADTNDFGAFFDFGDAPFVAFGDDNLPPNVPGPWGDPQVSFLAPTTGFYTVAVTNFASSTPPPSNFTIMAEGVQNPSAVPVPAGALLMGLGAIGLGAYRLRRRTPVVA